jgi:hypothetical protein
VHFFLLALAFIVIPVALASSEVPTTFLVISGLVTAVSAWVCRVGETVAD